MRCLGRLLLLLTPCGLLAPSAMADAASDVAAWSKIHPQVLERALADDTAELLILLDEQADVSAAFGLRSKRERGEHVFERLHEVAARTQRPLVGWLRARGVEHRAYWIANLVWARADLETIAAIAERAEVALIEPNSTMQSGIPEPDPGPGDGATPTSVGWGVAKIGADEVWALGYTGAGVVVAGHDTGYEWDHPALKNQYRGWDGQSAAHDHNWWDAIHSGGGPCGHDSPEPCDDIDHGTHTMGIMVGDDGASKQIGVAPGARWIGCRNMDDGDGSAVTYTECFQFFLAPTDLDGNDPDPALAPHVINNSWTCPTSEGCSHNALKTIVGNVRAAGIVLVGAATNLGMSCTTIDEPPAIYEEILTVGATTLSDSIWENSSRGPVTVDGSGRLKPDVTAPGMTILSSVTGGGYATISGTSMASPNVAGAIALLLDARPDLIGDVEAVELIVRQSAVPRTSLQDCGGIPGSQIPNPVYGWGRVDALEMIVGDADGDGVDNLTDCRPADDQLWQAPGAITDLTLTQTPSETEIAWSAPASAGSGSVSYDLLRSDLADDFAGATCLVSDAAATGATDADVPATVYYYAVRARSVCGENLGAASDGTPRTAGVCP